jgi:hypothetical protein
MIKLLLLSVCCILFSFFADAQSFIGLSTGFSRDINQNPNYSFYHIPITLQFKPFRKRWNVLFFEANYDIPIGATGSGKAYTANPSLPQEVTLSEKVAPYIFTGFAGVSFCFYIDKQRGDILYLNPMAGVCNQYVTVEYKNYDKANYEVLNPDIGSNNTSVVAALEVVYKFHNNLIVNFHMQTPLADDEGENYNHPLSYNSIAPLQLTLGYNFYYNKKKRNEVHIHHSRSDRY